MLICLAKSKEQPEKCCDSTSIALQIIMADLLTAIVGLVE